MSELRLVPAAVVVWTSVATLIVTGQPLAPLLIVAASVATMMVVAQPGQAVFVTATASAASVLAWVRMMRAAAFEFGDTVLATVAQAPRPSADGWLVRLRVDGYPPLLPVFSEDLPDGTATGALVAADISISESDWLGIGGVTASGELGVLRPAAGPVTLIRERLQDSVSVLIDASHAGLIPGMVLGDVSLQSEYAQQLYINTGLSHLSAVSGANVAIVTTAAVLLCRALALGPRTQVVAAVAALVGFVVLVGTEPSVLRAAVTGLVGLAAVVNSSRMQPIHALCLAIIGLLLVDSDLAVTYGFALSVAATAGIVTLTGVLARPLMRAGLPEILARALAVAIAADVVTMPIIALMAGQVSLVSVLANVLVAPVSAPITIVGLIATGLLWLPGPLGSLALQAIAPLTWWIHTVAEWAASLPVVTVAADPVWVVVAYGWVLAALIAGRIRLLAAVGVVAVAVTVTVTMGTPRAQEVDLATLAVYVVDTVDEVASAPAGTQVIVVKDPQGRAAKRPTVTADGTPVLFPNRDGPVALFTDGTQRAGDGRF